MYTVYRDFCWNLTLKACDNPKSHPITKGASVKAVGVLLVPKQLQLIQVINYIRL